MVACQSWNVINVASLDTFYWIMIRRGAEFTEGGKLRNFNLLWSKTPTDCCYLVFPDRNFSDAIIHLLFYGDGRDIGQIRCKSVKPSAKVQTRMVSLIRCRVLCVQRILRGRVLISAGVDYEMKGRLCLGLVILSLRFVRSVTGDF